LQNKQLEPSRQKLQFDKFNEQETQSPTLR